MKHFRIQFKNKSYTIFAKDAATASKIAMAMERKRLEIPGYTEIPKITVLRSPIGMRLLSDA